MGKKMVFFTGRPGGAGLRAAKAVGRHCAMTCWTFWESSFSEKGFWMKPLQPRAMIWLALPSRL
jgi:hypothetical protein